MDECFDDHESEAAEAMLEMPSVAPDPTDWEALRVQLAEICEIEAVRARAASEARALEEPEAILCKCKQVSRRRIVGLIDAGLSRHDIAQLTGAGQTCGGCAALQIDQLVGATSLSPVTLVDRQMLDKLHTRFTFNVPEHDVPPQPGDHIILEAQIYGRTLARTYTLTGWDSIKRTYDIIVRYEPNGVFSRWLHDFATATSKLRISRPAGAAEMRAGEPQFFFAGGIGVTPALARIKTMGAGSSSIWLHWSGRFREASRLTSEVVETVGRTWNADAMLRDTTRQGRLSRDEIVAMLPYDGVGSVHVCGPVTYMDDVMAALASAGWPADRIVGESFVAAVHEPLRPTQVTFDAHRDPIVAQSFSLRPTSSLIGEATAFLKQFYVEHGASVPFETRMAAIEAEIDATGTYKQTYDELAYGARLAWRNSTRCVGRFFWQMLTVRDMRHVETEEGVFTAVVDHIRWATNGGDLRPAITVFRSGGPEIRIMNPQLILYAGYPQPDGTVLGDPKNVEFTAFAQALGWEGRGTRFDILPLIIRIGANTPRLFTLPENLVLEVALEHPERAAFAELGLKWFALPAVADMALDLGGLQYTAAPSSGVYMGTEIGSFNLSDPRRYDMLPTVAEALGYEVDEDNPLWRDQALLEVNRAVLHSFRKAGVRIIDHHALSKYFMKFMAQEKTENRPVYGHWPWIVPPMSANLSDIWHDKTLKNVIVKPNYFYQKRGGYLASRQETAEGCPAVHVAGAGGCPAHH